MTIADGFAALRYAHRNPSWREYQNASPCDRRAIVARWSSILDEPLTWANTAGPDRAKRDRAQTNWHRALVGQPAAHKSHCGEFEEYEGEASERQVDQRGFNLAQPE